MPKRVWGLTSFFTQVDIIKSGRRLWRLWLIGSMDDSGRPDSNTWAEAGRTRGSGLGAEEGGR